MVRVSWQRGILRSASITRADEPLDRNPSFLHCVQEVTRTLEVPELRIKPPKSPESKMMSKVGETPVPAPKIHGSRSGTILISYPLYFTFERA